MIDRIWRWLLALVGRNAERPVAVAPEPRRRRKAPDASEVHSQGEYYFRGAILDQLDAYFTILKRLRRGDRDAYDFFSKVGAHIIPNQMLLQRATLSPRWGATGPSRGGVLFTEKDAEFEKGSRDRQIYPRMLHFSRWRRKALEGCQAPRAGAMVYTATVHWDDPSDPKIEPTPTEFAVEVTKAGDVRVLLQKHNIQPLIRPKRKGKGREQAFRPVIRRWVHHPFFVDWAKEHDRETGEFLAEIFIIAANTWLDATENSMTRVNVSKGDLTGVFAVNIERTPYFFKDRNVLSNRRRKIFHIVRAHERATKGGKASVVRTHFRGEREFEWNGYQVVVSVPGWHHRSLFDFKAEGLNAETYKGKEKVLDAFELGEELAGHLRGHAKLVERGNRRSAN